MYFDEVKSKLLQQPRRWLITGCAGFIGSNLLETLLKHDQEVVGLDNLSTGYQRNMDEVESLVSPEQWCRFKFVQGDIRDIATCRSVTKGIDYVLHQAALGSVPRSLNDPIATNDVNVNGHLNMMVAASEDGVKAFVYAASSSTYGDHPDLPKVENRIGKPLSPYAVTKYVNEVYADVFHRCYGFSTIGLRYFNVFGKRQDPEGAYAAVIPKWIAAMLRNEDVVINGDGLTSRDFCYIENVVQANILAAFSDSIEAKNQVYNVAVGDNTNLNQLIILIREVIEKSGVVSKSNIVHQAARKGDVRHSQASIEKIVGLLKYEPRIRLADGLADSIFWYKTRFQC